MANKRGPRNNGASRSITHHSREQASALPPPENHYPGDEGPSDIALEDRVRRMEESQEEILRLLKESRKQVLIPPQGTRVSQGRLNGGATQRRNSPTRPPYSVAEVPRASRRNNDLLDTASSTHPSRLPQQPFGPTGAPEVTVEPRLNGPPRHTIRDEIRRMVQEELPLRERNYPTRRNFHEFSPLGDVILNHRIPPGFKLPNMEPYDGSSDPFEHIDYYRTIMHIQRATDALLCQVFPATLKGQARTWFYSIPRGTIHAFGELAHLFIQQFIANKRIIKDSSHLSGIRQKEGESLREYFKRFSSEARQIPGVDPELLRGVLLGGLRPGPFYSSLMRDTVRSYADLIHRVEAQISADEAIDSHRRQFDPSLEKRKNATESRDDQYKKNKVSYKEDRHIPPRPQNQQRGRYEEKNYTELNTSRANILLAIQNEHNVKWPQPLKNNTGNQDLYCHFHRSRGHTTDACKQLKEEIERLIRQGYLGRFAKNPPVQANNPQSGGQPTERQAPERVQVIREIE